MRIPLSTGHRCHACLTVVIARIRSKTCPICLGLRPQVLSKCAFWWLENGDESSRSMCLSLTLLMLHCWNHFNWRIEQVSKGVMTIDPKVMVATTKLVVRMPRKAGDRYLPAVKPHHQTKASKCAAVYVSMMYFTVPEGSRSVLCYHRGLELSCILPETGMAYKITSCMFDQGLKVVPLLLQPMLRPHHSGQLQCARSKCFDKQAGLPANTNSSMQGSHVSSLRSRLLPNPQNESSCRCIILPASLSLRWTIFCNSLNALLCSSRANRSQSLPEPLSQLRFAKLIQLKQTLFAQVDALHVGSVLCGWA